MTKNLNNWIRFDYYWKCVRPHVRPTYIYYPTLAGIPPRRRSPRHNNSMYDIVHQSHADPKLYNCKNEAW